jgi:oligopeptide transport system ATP-binding protein
MTDAAAPLVEVSDLTVHFAGRGNLLGRLLGKGPVVHAVNGISFAIGRREVLGLVGESGSGKTTTGRVLARLVPPTSGRVRLAGEDWLKLEGPALRRRRRDVQMIFQNPFASLDPKWSVERIVAEPLRTHEKRLATAELRDRVATLLADVGLDPRLGSRYPHQFSGGQRQRIGLARAMALNPRLLIADEPVSALDVSIQAQILNLLQDLKARHALSMLFVSHDLAVVRCICDRVAVMYLGTLVEIAETKLLYRAPRHPYTQALLSAIPDPQRRRSRQRIQLSGEIPSPINPPSGCVFHPRCAKAQAICAVERPLLRRLDDGRVAACHFA